MPNWLKFGTPLILVILLISLIVKRVPATTIFTIMALLISVLSLAYQVWRTGLVQAADLLMRLEQKFFGQENRGQRSLAAVNNLGNPDDFTEMEDVLDFFETVAMFTRKEALNLYMVWHTFDYWMERYYAIALPHIISSQLSDPGRWEDLEWIIPKVRSLNKKKIAELNRKNPSGIGKPGSIDKEEMLRFLKEEAAEGEPTSPPRAVLQTPPA